MKKITVLIAIVVVAAGIAAFYLVRGGASLSVSESPTISVSSTSTPSESPSVSPTPVGSGVYGIITTSPTCPGPDYNPPRLGCEPRPLATKFLIKNKSGVTVASGSTGSDGRFSIKLAAGDYIFSALQPMGQIYVNQSFRVTANQYTNLVVDLDSGIR